MEAVARKHSLDAQTLTDVVAYVSALRWTGSRDHGDGSHLDHGEILYQRQCSACHGTDGGGDAATTVPRVAGQHYTYLLRQLYDAVGGRRPNFSVQHIRLLEPFERDDFVGLADYMSRLMPASQP